MSMVLLDELDKKLLEFLQKDARIKVTRLAEILNKPRTTVMSRIEKLESEKLILGYRAVVDLRKLGYNVLAFVLISAKRIAPISGRSSQEVLVERILRDTDDRGELPWIEEAHIVTGSYDIILKVWARDMRQLSDFLIKYLPSHPEVAKTETFLVLEQICDSRERYLPATKI